MQISLAQDTSWAETHLGGGLGLRLGGGLQPPKPRPSYVPAVGRPMEAANFPHSMHFKLTLDALSDGHQNLGRCKFLKSKFRGGSFLRMRDFSPLGTKRLGYFLCGGFLTKAERRAPILTQKYVKRRVSAKGSAF